MKKKVNRERVSSRTQPSESSKMLHELFQDFVDISSGKFNPKKNESRNF